MDKDVLTAAIDAFCQTVALKLRQLREVVPKGTNAKLTGDFVEEVVRGFIKQWITPCELLHGTLHPHHPVPELQNTEDGPKELDGIIYDPRIGPTVIREGQFIVVHPAFCRGVIEVKTSEGNLAAFQQRLRAVYVQYMRHYEARPSQVMGIVLQDPDPEGHSHPDHLQGHPLFLCRASWHPVFILFNNDYEPYKPAVDGLIRAIYRGPIQDTRPYVM